MYEVVYRFADLKDGSHVYEVGDQYPREGYEPASERIEELSGTQNKIGRILIVKKKEEKKKKDKAQLVEADAEDVTKDKKVAEK